MTGFVLRRYMAADTDWVIGEHARHYAENDGFDDSFAALVAQVVEAFTAGHDPSCERGWVAERDGARQGCIFCVRLDAQTANLRLFLVRPDARGTGLGRHLLETCMAFARSSGYARMQLWTHESHEAACRLYRRAGWQLNDSRPVRSFGCDLVEQNWRITL